MIFQRQGNAYFNRGSVTSEIGNQPGAIADLQKATDLFRAQGNQANYQRAMTELEQGETIGLQRVILIWIQCVADLQYLANTLDNETNMKIASTLESSATTAAFTL